MALLAGGSLFGLLGDCNDKLINLTRFVDPCGTVFANCAPGDIIISDAGIADFCIDPGCTVPGGCGTIALGTITEVCP